MKSSRGRGSQELLQDVGVPLRDPSAASEVTEVMAGHASMVTTAQIKTQSALLWGFSGLVGVNERGGLWISCQGPNSVFFICPSLNVH
jgi:hypothetical protein